MDQSTFNENSTSCGIPPAADFVEEEVQESSYDFQYNKVIEEVKKISKTKPTVCLIFKSLPCENLISELEKQGYDVKFDAYYDSTKEVKYNSKIRITNPKFATKGQTFIDKLEDQLKGCAYSQANFQVSEDAKNLFDSFMGSFGVQKN